MGREVRRVPAGWQHPVDESGDYVPLEGDSFSARLLRWEEGKAKWAEGLIADWPSGWKPVDPDVTSKTFEEWDGERPQEQDYMPDWPESERTHYQMYETTEGTPISPVMASPQELAQWLVDNEASAFGGMTASYDAWLRVCEGGYASSGVFKGGKMESGVEALTEPADREGGRPDIIDA